MCSIHEAIDLLENIFQFDPTRRPSCQEVLAHDFFNYLGDERDPNNEPEGVKFNDQFEDQGLTEDDFKSTHFLFLYIIFIVDYILKGFIYKTFKE